MPTLAQLKKKARDIGFIKEMESLGFSCGSNGFWFYRNRGGIIDLWSFHVKSSLEWMEIDLASKTFGMSPEYDCMKFPKGYNLSFGTGLLLDKRGLRMAGYAWDISGDEKIKEAFEKIAQIVKDDLVPWFDKIQTGEDVYNSLSLSVREGPAGERYRKLLLWC